MIENHSIQPKIKKEKFFYMLMNMGFFWILLRHQRPWASEGVGRKKEGFAPCILKCDIFLLMF